MLCLAWDQAPHWGKKELKKSASENIFPIFLFFAFFPHCGARSGYVML